MSMRNTLWKAGLALAGAAFRVAFYAAVAVLIFWIMKYSYQFGYDVFNQQPMSPGDGQIVTIVVPQGADDQAIGGILEAKGLIGNKYVFFVQQFLSGYRGKLEPGTYQLSTAYTPTRIMGILSGEEASP